MARVGRKPHKSEKAARGDNQTMKVEIEGMHCDACVRRVTNALEKVDGAEVERVEVGSAEVKVDPVRAEQILEAIRSAGFNPRGVA